MDKQNQTPDPNKNDSWLDDILGARNVPRELGPDEMAVAAAGLTHPDDAELERIVQETMAENWGEEETPASAPAPAVPNPTKKKTAPKAQSAAKNAPEESTQNKGGFKGFLERFQGSNKKPYGLFGIPHIIATGIWLAIIVAIGITLGHLGWACASDLLALGKEPQEVTITIEEGDDITAVADKLEKAGLIRYPKLFELFANLTGKGENILVGSITFNGENSEEGQPMITYDYNALINAMSYRGGAIVTVEVMIPEGYSCAQIFALLEEKGVCSAAELEAYAAEGELPDYWFIRDLDRGHKYCLEGFLFPDTYEFYLDDEPGNVLEKFLDDFDYRFTDRMLDKYATLLRESGLNLSIQEVVTMASIIEKEKANNLEGYTISSVFYNRLRNSASYPYLNSDATLLYDVEYYTGRPMSDAEELASPYNTYTQIGLPKGPIANPGLSSLDAALAPEKTDYYFFVFDKSANQHRFSRTLDEHEKLTIELGY